MTERIKPKIPMRYDKIKVCKAIIDRAKILVKHSEDKEEISQWMEEKFGVLLWSIKDMKPETLNEILDNLERNKK